MRRAIAKPQAGFTLIELLVALAIAAILVLAEVGPFQRAIATRDHAEDALDRTEEARITLQRIGEELTGAVPLKGHSFTVADKTFDFPSSELSFVTSAARRLQHGAQDPFEIVRYRLEPPTRGERGARLIKEQLPSVAADGTPPAQIVVLPNVAAFRVRAVQDLNQGWQMTWQGGSSGDTKDLPRAVEVELELVEDNPSIEPTPYRIAVTLPLRPVT